MRWRGDGGDARQAVCCCRISSKFKEIVLIIYLVLDFRLKQREIMISSQSLLLRVNDCCRLYKLWPTLGTMFSETTLKCALDDANNLCGLKTERRGLKIKVMHQLRSMKMPI